MPSAASLDVQPIEFDDWDALLVTFPDRTVFHGRAWLETVAATHRLRIVLAGAFDGGRAVAIWPQLQLRKGPLKVIGSPLPGWSTAYMGPLFASDADVSAALKAFLHDRLFRRAAYFACKIIDRNRAVDLAPFGFNAVRRFDTYLIDLRMSEDQLWSNLKSECRTRIRKAKRLGLEVRQEITSDFLADYWAMSLETFSKAGIEPTHNRRFVEELWNRLSARAQVVAVSAFHQNRRLATLVLPHDEHTMYYWGGASFTEFREMPSHNLLHWHAICRARSMGLREYDFISTKGGPGRFKSTFGPNAVDVATHWERSASKLMANLKQRYERYLRRRRQLS